MSEQSPTPGWQEIELREGDQVIVNGALLSATAACTLRVGCGASVLEGRALLSRAGRPAAAHELYYAALGASGSEAALAASRLRLFSALGEVVARQRTRAAQVDCTSFAAALLSGDVDGLLGAARRLAAREAGGLLRLDRSRAA
jgi:hypothetical protein